jgi:plasmid maintenance system antidote protein VapI
MIPHYRDPQASQRVGHFIAEHLKKSGLPIDELAEQLGLKPAKVIYFLTGRHYFPLEMVAPFARALNIDDVATFVYYVQLQYDPRKAVNYAFEAICAYAVRKQEQTDETEEQADEVPEGNPDEMEEERKEEKEENGKKQKTKKPRDAGLSK